MASQWGVEKRGSPRAMKKLDLLLGTLSGSRECRRGSDDLQMGVRQRARGPKRERLLGEEVDKNWTEGTDSRVFSKPDFV